MTGHRASVAASVSEDPTDLFELARLLSLAIGLVFEWVVTDPLNLFVAVYLVTVLILGWIVVHRV
jgi:hypothetical protein